MPMKVKDLRESGVIRLLTDKVVRERRGADSARSHGFKLLVDAGDDTAAWCNGAVTELHTTDTAVEGVHFTRDTTPWADLGWKLMAANVSDIAAMGGSPLFALITLGMPPDTEVADLESLYEGANELSNKYGVAIVGGDLVRSPVVFATVSLTGVCRGDPMLRSAARPGDLIAVTGHLGSSAGGLEIMLNNLPVEGGARDHLATAHRRPEPCVSQGQLLSQNGVRAAMDISDGLVEDLSKLCQASAVAARVAADKIPIHPALKLAFPKEHMDMALGGGEDYQLLFTAPPELMERVIALLPSPAAVAGEIVEGEVGKVTVLDSATGEALRTARTGWDHFAPAQMASEG